MEHREENYSDADKWAVLQSPILVMWALMMVVAAVQEAHLAGYRVMRS